MSNVGPFTFLSLLKTNDMACQLMHNLPEQMHLLRTINVTNVHVMVVILVVLDQVAVFWG